MVYSDISYASCSSELQRLATSRPDLASLNTAQALYNLPHAGNCRLGGSRVEPCKTHILEITNRTSLAADPGRAEVLISGALHGDERVGPATALALARWLVERYDSDAWIRRLVDTRTVLIMPMTNALGYFRYTREENGVDPNRDFPYNTDKVSLRMAFTCLTPPLK